MPGGKKYFVDLKELQADSKIQFVKISEVSNGKRSSIIIGSQGNNQGNKDRPRLVCLIACPNEPVSIAAQAYHNGQL